MKDQEKGVAMLKAKDHITLLTEMIRRAIPFVEDAGNSEAEYLNDTSEASEWLSLARAIDQEDLRRGFASMGASLIEWKALTGALMEAALLFRETHADRCCFPKLNKLPETELCRGNRDLQKAIDAIRTEENRK